MFVTRGKRSSRWLLPFGRQPESKTQCFVKLFLRDLSTADDSGSAPAFARVSPLVSIYFYIEHVGKVTPCCKDSVNFAVVSQNHIVLPRFFFCFHGAKVHKLSSVFQKLSSNTGKSKASQGKNQKVNVPVYVKNVVLASSLEIAEQQ